METIEMPKTYRERLEELNVGDNILIDVEHRKVWANTITAIHKKTNNQFHFTIRTQPGTDEIRVWRLK